MPALVARDIMGYVVGWLVFAMRVTGWRRCSVGRTWGRFIAAWNWCNVIEGMLLVVVGGIPGLLGAPPIVGEACRTVAIGWALWIEWYATRLAFGVERTDGGMAGGAGSVDRDHAGRAGGVDQSLTG